MRRVLAILFIFGAICFVAWTESASAAFAASGAGNESAVLQADHDFQQSLTKNDAMAAGVLLDQDFSWTDENGRTRNRAQFLKDAASGAANSGAEYTDVKARDYGQLAIVIGSGVVQGKPRTFFARIWVEHKAGWLLLVHQDTGIRAPGEIQKPAATGRIPPDMATCENPCRTVPYTAKTPEQSDVVKAYQAVETAVTSHDPATWAYHVADEFVGIGRQYTGTPDTKEGRVGQVGIVSNRVILPKMLWLKVYVFGDAAIMIADHLPLGERPYHVIRVWVNRDGRWQLFHRQETTIARATGTPQVR
jgi:hypothetical protein